MSEKLGVFVVRDKALQSGRAVFSISQIAHLIGKPYPVAAVYASRLVKKGLATRPLRGKIAFSTDDFVISCQLFEPSYVSLHSALSFHGLLQQVPRYVECVTTRNSRNYVKLGLSYHKIPPSLFFGYERQLRAGSYAFIAEPEKALLDGVYLNSFPRKLVSELLEKMNQEKLHAYCKALRGRGAKKLREWLL